MTKETLQSKTELEPLALGLAETFIQRWDLYARQLKDGRYICVRQPLETIHLISHLKREPLSTNIRLDRQRLGLASGELRAFDALAGASVALENDTLPLSFDTMSYRLIEVRDRHFKLRPARQSTGG